MPYTTRTVEVVYDEETRSRVEVSDTPEDDGMLSVSSYDPEGALSSEVTMPVPMALKVAQAVIRQASRMRCREKGLMELVKDANEMERRERETDPPPRPPSGEFSVVPPSDRRSLLPPRSGQG